MTVSLMQTMCSTKKEVLRWHSTAAEWGCRNKFTNFVWIRFGTFTAKPSLLRVTSYQHSNHSYLKRGFRSGSTFRLISLMSCCKRAFQVSFSATNLSIARPRSVLSRTWSLVRSALLKPLYQLFDLSRLHFQSKAYLHPAFENGWEQDCLFIQKLAFFLVLSSRRIWTSSRCPNLIKHSLGACSISYDYRKSRRRISFIFA